MIVRTPDGKWAVYSEALATLTRTGLDERAAISEISLEVGSIDRARELLAESGAAWESALALMPAPTRAATLRRYGQTPAPPPVATVRRQERKAQAVRAKQISAAARLERERERWRRRNEQRKAARAAARAKFTPKPKPAFAPGTRYTPKPTTTPEYQRDRHRINARGSKRLAGAAVSAQIARQRAQRVAVYLLCGVYERAAAVCRCSPEGIKSALRLAGVEPIAKRTPPAVEVERTMRNFGFSDADIARAVKILKKK